MWKKDFFPLLSFHALHLFSPQKKIFMNSFNDIHEN